jgi:hypothetical protein
VSSPEYNQPENKKPAGAYCASGPKSALFSESLCTPQQARHVAVIMMVRPRCLCAVHLRNIKIKEFRLHVNESILDFPAGILLPGNLSRK